MKRHKYWNWKKLRRSNVHMKLTRCLGYPICEYLREFSQNCQGWRASHLSARLWKAGGCRRLRKSGIQSSFPPHWHSQGLLGSQWCLEGLEDKSKVTGNRKEGCRYMILSVLFPAGALHSLVNSNQNKWSL